MPITGGRPIVMPIQNASFDGTLDLSEVDNLADIPVQLGLEIGEDVQAYAVELDIISANDDNTNLDLGGINLFVRQLQSGAGLFSISESSGTVLRVSAPEGYEGNLQEWQIDEANVAWLDENGEFHGSISGYYSETQSNDRFFYNKPDGLNLQYGRAFPAMGATFIDVEYPNDFEDGMPYLLGEPALVAPTPGLTEYFVARVEDLTSSGFRAIFNDALPADEFVLHWSVIRNTPAA